MKSILTRFPDLPQRYLVIGEGDVFRKPTLVQTVLGSCVAVTFFVPGLGIGGTFHALLSRWRSHNDTPPGADRFKFVDSAIDSLCRVLFRQGLEPRDIECKIFGGANSLLKGELGAGRKNVEAAIESLAMHGLRVLATDVGGTNGRKIVFISHTGDVFVKRLGR